MFTCVLAYADNLVLLASSQHGVRTMLRVCEEYAGEYNMQFNASKSKCIVCNPRFGNRCNMFCYSPHFTACDSAFEIVDSLRTFTNFVITFTILAGIIAALTFMTYVSYVGLLFYVLLLYWLRSVNLY